MWWSKKKQEYPDFWNTYAELFTKKQEHNLNLSETTFTVLDTETTGFNFSDDRILSIGALKLVKNAIAIDRVFDVYVEQDIYKKESIKVHGILKHTKRKLISEQEALIKFLAYVEDNIIVAHHAKFDITMINRTLRRNNLPELKNKVLDTSTLYKKTLLRSNLLKQKDAYSLDELAEKYNISMKDRHTALGDAYITAVAFLKILTKLKEKKAISLKWLLKQAT